MESREERDEEREGEVVDQGTLDWEAWSSLKAGRGDAHLAITTDS